MTKLLNARGLWRVLLIIATICSFALKKSFDCNAIYSTYGIVWTIFIPLATGVFFWLVFEILVGFWHVGIKEKMPFEVTSQQFLNLARFFVIILNVLIFAFYKIILAINFYPNFMLLLASLVLTFLYILTIWLVLKKKICKGAKTDKKLELLFFSFGFLFLFMNTILWGVL